MNEPLQAIRTVDLKIYNFFGFFAGNRLLDHLASREEGNNLFKGGIFFAILVSVVSYRSLVNLYQWAGWIALGPVPRGSINRDWTCLNGQYVTELAHKEAVVVLASEPASATHASACNALRPTPPSTCTFKLTR
jgi:hypothetical protein